MVLLFSQSNARYRCLFPWSLVMVMSCFYLKQIFAIMIYWEICKKFRTFLLTMKVDWLKPCCIWRLVLQICLNQITNRWNRQQIFHTIKQYIFNSNLYCWMLPTWNINNSLGKIYWIIFMLHLQCNVPWIIYLTTNLFWGLFNSNQTDEIDYSCYIA